MVDEKIKAALTPDEWRDGYVDWGAFYSHTGASLNPRDGGIEVYNDGDRNSIPVPYIPALIALANHSLPDSHPLKITRADVRKLAEIGRGLQSSFISGEIDEGDFISAFASRLTALLPPDA